MKITVCDGCRVRIADNDTGAARDVRLGGGLVDWCNDCVIVIRTELPRIVAEAKAVRREAALVPVQSRALNVWDGVRHGSMRTRG